MSFPPRAQSGRGPFLLILIFAVFAIAVISGVVRLPADARSLKVEPCEQGVIYRGPVGLPAIRVRIDLLGQLLEARKFEHGAEVGVQRGRNAHSLLSNWKHCKSFKLIDLWGHQENYIDGANVNQQMQQRYYEETQTTLAPWKDKTTFYRMLSVEAAKQIPDTSLDFIYVDARHDYCGVKEDLEAYYPKLRPGGIMAGHDYRDAAEVKKVLPKEDWSVCMDGSVNAGAVKGAVEEFAEKNGLVISVMYNDDWPSWMIQKPTRMECVKEMGSWGSQVTQG